MKQGDRFILTGKLINALHLGAGHDEGCVYVIEETNSVHHCLRSDWGRVNFVDRNIGFTLPFAYQWMAGRILSFEECLKRYPRLIFFMQMAAILSKSEAACAIRDYHRGWLSGEAVEHYGGAVEVIHAAITQRHYRQRAIREYLNKEQKK